MTRECSHRRACATRRGGGRFRGRPGCVTMPAMARRPLRACALVVTTLATACTGSASTTDAGPDARPDAAHAGTDAALTDVAPTDDLVDAPEDLDAADADLDDGIEPPPD